ncbi:MULTISPECIES: serine hydrolase [Variovorax]|nr:MULTISPECIES: serine hydrolase [Variovorax]WPG35955.1 serine hydrolase [Variovorax boronicumulans]
MHPMISLAEDEDPWGRASGYPTGWGTPRGLSRDKRMRVGNFSGGFEAMLPSRTIQCGQEDPLQDRPRSDLRYHFNGVSKTPDDYMATSPVTGLLIARRGEVWWEKYQFGRTPEMRMMGWSMSKSVTSLLLGIAIDQKLIASLEDKASLYVPWLAGTLHGEVSLRNLMNMSSGAEIVHDQANNTIYPAALTGPRADIKPTVRDWNVRREVEGSRFNYNELCPLTIGMVLRAATRMSLSEYAEQFLWRPMGAEANATWLTDRHRNEFNCIGFAATLRDWSRLGRLVAQGGQMNGKQIVSREWMESYGRWESNEAQVRYGALGTPFPAAYKAFIWHTKSDGTRPLFSGAEGQRVLIDVPTQTVLAQTGIDGTGDWQREIYALFQAAVTAR